MAAPPRYHRLPDDDLESQLPHAKSSSAYLPTIDDENTLPTPSSSRPIITYTYQSKTKPGPTHVVGRLGFTKNETAQIAREAFPELANYRVDQIEFSVPVDGTSGWARIMDNAWDGFEAASPGRMTVQVIGDDSVHGDGQQAEKEKEELPPGVTLFIACAFLLFIYFKS